MSIQSIETEVNAIQPIIGNFLKEIQADLFSQAAVDNAFTKAMHAIDQIAKLVAAAAPVAAAIAPLCGTAAPAVAGGAALAETLAPVVEKQVEGVGLPS